MKTEGANAAPGGAGLDTSSLRGFAGVGIAGSNTYQIINAATSAVGIAATPNRRNIASALSACGIAGDLGAGARTNLADQLAISALQRRDADLAALAAGSNRLGDRAVCQAWRRGIWFADFTYLCTPTRMTSNGGYTPGQLRWREGREHIFARAQRMLPLLLDSCGYRREISHTAPRWAHRFELYLEAIPFLDPDGYASWDYPGSRRRSMEALRTLMSTYPDDVDSGKMWPVYSIRWEPQQATSSRFHLPAWATGHLDSLIPLNKTQRPYTQATREQWARQAVLAALKVANDPDFQFMVRRFHRVMLGGMVDGPIPRMVRHLFAAVLCECYPDAQLWLLGQANCLTVNGLGTLHLLDRVWVDGSWYLQDARCEKFAYVDHGLITMLQIGAGMDAQGQALRQTFFSLSELMAANLRSLLAAYEGLIQWPSVSLPIDVRDWEQLRELQQHYQQAQFELGI